MPAAHPVSARRRDMAAEPGPNVLPIAALKADVVPVDELHRAYQERAK